MMCTNNTNQSATDQPDKEIFLQSCTPKKAFIQTTSKPIEVWENRFQMDIKKRHTFFWSIDCKAFKVLWISIFRSTPVSFFFKQQRKDRKKSKHCVNVYSDSSYFYKSANMYYIGKIFNKWHTRIFVSFTYFSGAKTNNRI